MAEISGLVDLSKVCTGLVYKMGLDPYYQTKFYQFGIDGITELKLYSLGETKVEKLEMDADLNTIDFPSDYMKFVDLGIPINGQLWSLTKNNSIIDTTTIVNGQETYDTDIGEGDWDFILDNKAGGFNDRYYKIDEKGRRIVISGIEAITVWLVYISTGVYTDEPTYIPRAVKPVIEAFIRNEYYCNMPDAPAAKVQMYERKLRIQKNRLKRLTYPTLQELADSLAKTYHRHTK